MSTVNYKDKNNLVWTYASGLGEALKVLENFCMFSIEENKKLYIYPWYVEQILGKTGSRRLIFFDTWSDIFLKYFIPSVPYEYVSTHCKNYIQYKKLYPSIWYQNDKYVTMYSSEFKYVKATLEFQKFDSEYIVLNKKYDIQNRIGISLRLDELKDFKFLIKLSKLYTKLFIAVDNLSIWNNVKHIFKKNDIFMLDIPRSTKFDNYARYWADYPYGVLNTFRSKELFIQSRENALKEAYFLSKCKQYIKYMNSSNYSSILIPFLQKSFNS